MVELRKLTTERTALVFGATGYTGREVVRRWAACGPVVAHVRPDSPSASTSHSAFEALGAVVRVVPWEPALLEELIGEVKPAVVFGLLGTTRARARRELSTEDANTPYRSVDERLSIMAATAVVHAAPASLFIFLSALGVNERTNNAYLKARYRVERALTTMQLRHVVARPALISGADRAEFRVGERVAAVGLDAVLRLGALSGLPGLRQLRQKYASLSGDQLAAALVAIGLDGSRTGEVFAAELRKLAAIDMERAG